MLTKENYLEQRCDGTTKREIMENEGLNYPQLQKMLDRWGIKGAEDEVREIRALSPTGSEQSAQPPVAQVAPAVQPRNCTDSIEWLSPNTLANCVRVTKKGLKVVGDIEQQFSGVEFVQIGFASDSVFVKPDTSGWSIRKDTASAGLIVTGKKLVSELERRKFLIGDHPATWQDGMLAASRN